MSFLYLPFPRPRRNLWTTLLWLMYFLSPNVIVLLLVSILSMESHSGFINVILSNVPKTNNSLLVCLFIYYDYFLCSFYFLHSLCFFRVSFRSISFGLSLLGRLSLEMYLHLKVTHIKEDDTWPSVGLANLNVSKENSKVIVIFYWCLTDRSI